MGRLLRLLVWMRLTDDDGLFSITHMACYLAFFCMVTGRPVSWTEMGGFLIAMSSYRVKRALEDGKDSNTADARMQALEDKVAKLSSPDRLQQLAQSMGRPSAR